MEFFKSSMKFPEKPKVKPQKLMVSRNMDTMTDKKMNGEMGENKMGALDSSEQLEEVFYL